MCVGPVVPSVPFTNSCGVVERLKVVESQVALEFLPVADAAEHVATTSATGMLFGHPAPESVNASAWMVKFQLLEPLALFTFAVTTTGEDAVTVPPGLLPVKVTVKGLTVSELMAGL